MLQKTSLIFDAMFVVAGIVAFFAIAGGMV